MKNFPLRWTNEGWVITVDRYLSPEQLAKVLAYAVKIQTDRWRSLPHGDNRDAFGVAIELLRQGKIKQKLTENSNGELVLLEAKK